MRAVALTEFGSAPEVRDVPIPEPAEGEVRVRVHAASVNGFDLAVAAGYLNGMMEHRFPVVLGKDFAGAVDAVGEGVTGYAVGERVFGVVTKAFLGDGSFGELVTVPIAVGLARLPESVSFTDGAALGLAGTAAVDAVDAAQLEPGQVVLVTGATGGVGNQAIQLAAHAGATVIATAHSVEEQSLVTGLGAAEVVDYRQDVAAQVLAAHPGGVDAIVHLAGDGAALLPALRDGGRFASTLLGSPDQLPTQTATVAPVYATPTTATLDRLAQNSADQHTTVTIQKIYDLDEVAQAFADFGAGTRGKLVLTIA
ncbi:NADP-dependent oxidoreductase [Cellulomonas sp. KRMCY2]|uniref:NADP-dependent oxidoreductase n=1 Tax=Cellulomonas sp. KRMCY2 TaxID=1304865 RepID=UPI00045E5FF3|nr:NADP-dependent oxidoreductase [Cellulomonas sp. KRMCY2]